MEDEGKGKSHYVRFNEDNDGAPSAHPIQDAIIITDVTGFEEPATMSGNVVHIDQNTPRKKRRNTCCQSCCVCIASTLISIAICVAIIVGLILLWVYSAYGTTQVKVCFSSCPPDHHLAVCINNLIIILITISW